MFSSANMKEILPTIMRIQKFENSPLWPRTARNSAFFHQAVVSLDQFNEFCSHKALCCFSVDVYFVSGKYDPRSGFTFASESGKLHRKSRKRASDLLFLPKNKAAGFSVENTILQTSQEGNVRSNIERKLAVFWTGRAQVTTNLLILSRRLFSIITGTYCNLRGNRSVKYFNKDSGTRTGLFTKTTILNTMLCQCRKFSSLKVWMLVDCPSCQPDLDPRNFLFSPRISQPMRCRFKEVTAEIRDKQLTVLEAIPKSQIQRGFTQREKHWSR